MSRGCVPFTGCFAACPDPIDFRAYATMNLYDDENAYATTGLQSSLSTPKEKLPDKITKISPLR